MHTDFLKPLRASVEALVHPSARTDPRAFARHFFFIATRLALGLISFAALPAYLAVHGAPSRLEAMAYSWLLLHLFIALDLSRSGAFERAELLSAAILAAPLGLLAGIGGLGSFALWAALVPVEAALFCSRPVAIAAGACAVTAFGLAWAFAAAFLPAHLVDSASLGFAGGLAAAAYTALVLFGARATAEGDARRSEASAARYRAIAENTGELVTRHGRNGAVTFASSAAETLLGVAASRLIGHGLFDRVHVADRPAFLAAIGEAASKQTATRIEYRLRRGAEADERSPEPSFIWVETRCHPDDFDAGGGQSSKPQIVAVTKDISRRKATELALEVARSEAEIAHDAKYRFLATVGHELRTPLNAIIGFSEILMNAPGAAEAYRNDYARLVRDSGEHLLAVVNSILDVSRIESAQFTIRPRPCSVAAVIENALEIVRLDAGRKSVRLAAELAAAPAEIVADERALRQVVLNLLSNAIKFTGEGGSVVVDVRVQGGECVLTVADSGIGIAEGDLKQLGNPFFQAHAAYDRPYQGSGLGLSVVKGLVELHGGRMEIASRLGEGTRVGIRLPLDCRRDAAPRRDVARPANPIVVNETEKVRRRA